MKLKDLLPMVLAGVAGNAGKAAQIAVAAYLASQQADDQLHEAKVGDHVTLDIPEVAEPHFPTRSGKKFSVDAVIVVRRS